MKTKASLIVMSHLSDAQETLNYNNVSNYTDSIKRNINFAKYVILQCKGDLNQEIDADEMYIKFLNKYNQ
jgi:hypothetical protein